MEDNEYDGFLIGDMYHWELDSFGNLFVRENFDREAFPRMAEV